jgi:hypothetical protein
LWAAPRLVIDVGNKETLADSLQGSVLYRPVTDSSAPNLAIDPSQLPLQFSFDSIMQRAEEKMRTLELKIEGAEGDPTLERRLGEMVGQVLLEREYALLGLQIQSATTQNDTLLMSVLRFAIEELLRQNPQLQEMLLREALR